MTAPIVLFVYNRPNHTARTIEALKSNLLASESVLYIYSDAAKDEISKESVSQTRKYIHGVQGFKEIHIIERENNQGLAKSVISGISEVFKYDDKVIVLEDDIVTASNFLSFMNSSLDFYKNDDRIFSVSGYAYPIEIPSDYKEEVYLSRRGSSWGWGTWKDRWEKVDWQVKDRDKFLSDPSLQKAFNSAGEDQSTMLELQLRGRIDSWAIRFAYGAFRQGAYHLFPRISKTINIGHDNTGTHSKKTSRFQVALDKGNKELILPEFVEINEEILRNTSKFFKKNIVQQLYNKLRIRYPQIEQLLKR